MTRLENYYQDTLVPSMMEKFGYQSVMQVPRITKITLNMGVGEALVNKNAMESAVQTYRQFQGRNRSLQKHANQLLISRSGRGGQSVVRSRYDAKECMNFWIV